VADVPPSRWKTLIANKKILTLIHAIQEHSSTEALTEEPKDKKF
jgi:hypothetical protein